MARLLAELSIRDREGRELPVDDAFRRWHDLTAAILQPGSLDKSPWERLQLSRGQPDVQIWP